MIREVRTTVVKVIFSAIYVPDRSQAIRTTVRAAVWSPDQRPTFEHSTFHFRLGDTLEIFSCQEFIWNVNRACTLYSKKWYTSFYAILTFNVTITYMIKWGIEKAALCPASAHLSNSFSMAYFPANGTGMLMNTKTWHNCRMLQATQNWL